MLVFRQLDVDEVPTIVGHILAPILVAVSVGLELSGLELHSCGDTEPILTSRCFLFHFLQLHLRRVMHKDRFMRKSSILPAIGNRIMRDLIHNPLHLLFSVNVLGMASSTLASLSRGFAELSTDGQFLQLRSKQVITSH